MYLHLFLQDNVNLPTNLQPDEEQVGIKVILEYSFQTGVSRCNT